MNEVTDLNNMDFLSTIAEDKRTLEMFRYLVNNSFIRVVNYHNTEKVDAERFEREIAAFAENFTSVSMEDIDRFFETRKWDKEKPGLIPAVFEGFRNGYDVMLPILEKYGFKAWYYIPCFFMDIPVQEQLRFTEHYDLTVYHPEEYPDGRYAMTGTRCVRSPSTMRSAAIPEITSKSAERLRTTICIGKSWWPNGCWRHKSAGRWTCSAGSTARNTPTIPGHISI